MPINYDINLVRGTSFTARLIAKNADGTPIDLTNYNTRGYVKNNYSDTQALLDLNPQPVPGLEASGYVDVILPATGTQKLPITQGVYDIEMYNTGSAGEDLFVVKLLDGRVNIYPEVTNPGTTLIHYSDPVIGTAHSAEASWEAEGEIPLGLQASIGIVSPTGDQIFSYGTTQAALTVSIDGDTSIYSHWHWKTGEAFSEGAGNVAGGSMVTEGLSAIMNDLQDETDYAVHVALVDDDHKHLPPPVTASQSFSVEGPPPACTWETCAAAKAPLSIYPDVNIVTPLNDEIETSPVTLYVELMDSCTWAYVVENVYQVAEGSTNAFEGEGPGDQASANGHATVVEMTGTAPVSGPFSVQITSDFAGQALVPARSPYRISVVCTDSQGVHAGEPGGNYIPWSANGDQVSFYAVA